MACDIAFLAHDFSGTGVLRNAVRLANHAVHMGLQTEFWVTADQGILRSELHSAIQVQCLSGPLKINRPRRIADILAIPTLAAKIKSEKPKVLFSSGNHFHLTAVSAWHIAGKPENVRLTGRASNAMHGGFLRGIVGRFEALKFKAMQPIIAVAHELADQLKACGIASERIQVIPNGVDIASIQSSSLEALDDEWLQEDCPPVVISAGRLSKQKNFSLLIDAFARARRHMPLRLMILGEGPDQDRLTQQAKRLGLQADIRFMGHVANPTAYFGKAALFVLSSRWEGMSNVLIEAMASGLPVVAVRAPTGTAELLANGRMGPLVAANAENLAQAMMARLAQPRDGQILREHAAKYDLQRMLKDYEPYLRPINRSDPG